MWILSGHQTKETLRQSCSQLELLVLERTAELQSLSQRSGIKVRMDFSPEVARLPDTIEIALFRVLQESLTNVHRHSGTSEVEVCFRRDAQAAILEVRDYGRGM